MTGLNLVAVQDLIADHIISSFPNYDIKEDEVLDDESMLSISNKTKPFIVIRWHGLNRSTTAASFGGVRFDEYNSSFDVIFVAPSPRIARRGLNMVLDELIGWNINNGSQLTPVGGSAVFPSVNYEGKPHLYLAVNTLSFQVDSTGVGS
jgi:hypothetical protein